MDTYPRRPTDYEKRELAEIVFPDKPADQVDFTDVWLLAPLYNSELDFNCFGWSLITPQTISIPGKLDTLVFLAGEATKRYPVSPYDYVVVTSDTGPKAIRVWGDGRDDISHVSRICTQELLEKYKGSFNLKLKFGSSTAGFPSVVWSSKFGDRQGFITHPIDWLDGGVWGDKIQDLNIK